MADAPVAAPTVASLVDAQGNLTVYDHGPQPAPDDAAQPVKDAAIAEKKAWDLLHPDGYVGIRMPSTDAAHAVGSDPERYALEPAHIDEGAITAKMAEIRKRREAMVKAKEDAADRQQAIAEVISDHANATAAKAVIEPTKPKVAQRAHHAPHPHAPTPPKV